MTQQLAMFDDTNPAPIGREPAPWVEHHGVNTGGYSAGCRCTTCTEAWRDHNTLYRQGLRRCQHCKNTYPKTTGGGTKFCANCLANDVYFRNVPSVMGRRVACARCTTVYRKSTTARWDLCRSCTQQPAFQVMKGALGRHNAPVELVTAVIEWPYCANEGCGDWLLARAHYKRSDKSASRYVYNYVVDHDHACCQGERSCGKCIRGIICRACNNAMPHTLDHTRAQGILDYLTRRQP